MNIFYKLIDDVLTEARRSEKITAHDVLAKYANDPNVFISYINAISSDGKLIPKIGINPKSHYNTPLGVYTYPLKPFWIDLQENLTNVPFGGRNPYIAVIRVNNKGGKFIHNMVADYDETKFEEDLNKLKTNGHKSQKEMSKLRSIAERKIISKSLHLTLRV
jgi:hypothetical protein